MKVIVNLLSYSIAFFVATTMFGFGEASNKKVKLIFKNINSKEHTCRIYQMDFLDVEEITLAETKLDYSMTTIEFDLTKPTFAIMKIDEKFFSIYLAPGFNLTIYSDSNGNQLKFLGEGASVNNYLMMIQSINKKFDKAGGKYLWDLKIIDFINHIDSLKNAYSNFHNHYIDSVKVSKPILNYLIKKNTIHILLIKENYLAVHDNDNNVEFKIPESMKADLDKIDLDTALVNTHSGDYNTLFKMYMNRKIYAPLYEGKNAKEIEEMNQIIPHMANNYINNLKFDQPVIEYLQAINILYWMNSFGIISSTKNVLADFKQKYKKSLYIETLDIQYNKWNAISPDKNAPDIFGSELDGKEFRLSTLRGKVIYIDVWATWCAPCMSEISYSKQVQQKFEGDNRIIFLYVSVDRNQEAWKKRIANDKDWKGLHINDPIGSIYKNYLINGIPRYILIDQKGKIVNAFASRPSSGKVENEINEVLKSNLNK